MKKLFSVFIALLLLMPLYSFAITYDDDSYLGIWIQRNKMSISEYRITTLVLDENHTAFYAVEYYDNENVGDVSRYLCTWAVDGNLLTVMHGDEVVKELYRINQYQLSVDATGTYGLFYDRVQNSEIAHHTAESFTAPKEINMDPVGRWTSTYLDSTYHLDVNEEISAYDYYFLEDGTVYIVSLTVSKKDSTPVCNSNVGIWIGDSKGIVMRIGNSTQNARIDPDGTMILKLDNLSSLILYRVESDRQLYEINSDTLESIQ